jgi:hypothetical protein
MRDDIGLPGASALLLSTVLIGNVSVTAQRRAGTATNRASTVPRAADGHPDLQGTWTSATLSPLERPRNLATLGVF